MAGKCEIVFYLLEAQYDADQDEQISVEELLLALGLQCNSVMDPLFCRVLVLSRWWSRPRLRS